MANRRILFAPAAFLFALALLAGQWGADAIAGGERPHASGTDVVPPSGGITSTVAADADAAAVLASIPFDVSGMYLFNVGTQGWMSHTPEAPEWLNQGFTRELEAGAILWVRRSSTDTRGGLVWQSSTVATEFTAPLPLPVPPLGRMTAGVAGTTSVQSLIDAQPFTVRSVFAFDVAQQRFLSYSPVNPPWAHTLEANGLQPSSVVWLSRAEDDVPMVIADSSELARVGVPSSSTRSTPGNTVAATGWGSGPGGMAPGQTRAPSATATPLPSPTATPSVSLGTTTPTPTPTATATATATPQASPTPTPTVSSAANATLVRHLTFEDDYGGEMPGTQTNSGGIGRTSESARAGSKAGFAHLDASDPREPTTGGFRAEYHGNDHSGEGSERWHGISFFLPADFNQGTNSTWNDRIIFQFADEGSPMFSLHLDASAKQFWLRRKLPDLGSDGKPRFETLGRWSFDTGRWYEFVFHVEWTQSGSGVFEVFVDGQQRVNYTGRTLAVRDVTYSKWGIYGQPTRLLFDEVWRAEGSGTLGSVGP